MWNRLASLCINLSFILTTFTFFALVMFSLPTTLSVEANYTIASLLTIALSDLYLGGRKN